MPAASRQNAPLTRRHDLKYDWLKGPSVLLMVIGVTGVLADQLDKFESVSDFLDLPPLFYSIIIIALAAVLFVIALTSKGTRRKHDIDFLHDNWRSI